MKVQPVKQPDPSHPEEMLNTVKEMFNEGKSQVAIARHLNKKGYTGAFGGKWNSSSVGTLLRQIEILPTYSSYPEMMKQNAELKARVKDLEATLEHVMNEYYT